nr:PEP-CTERM sorting domain-containing protein [uncultured Duganella sp.]
MNNLQKAALNLVLGAGLIASHGAYADTLNFESAPLELSTYEGYRWQNFGTISHNDSAAYHPSGYQVGATSGTRLAYNAYGDPATLSSASSFNLVSGFFTAGWRDGLSLRVVGTGATSFDQTYTLSAFAPTEIVFNWTGLTSLTFSTSGGTFLNTYGGGNGYQFVLDDLRLTSAVPEPETYAMLLAGLGLLGFAARRKRSAA